MFDTVRRVLGRPAGPTSVRECRHCGATPPEAAHQCPVCESTEIAVYEL